MKPESKVKMKELALNIAEDHVMLAIDEVYAVAQIMVDDSDSAVDNSILSMLTLLKSNLKELADKIDGAVG